MRPGLTLDSGEFVPADDLNAALVEAQQPAPSAAAAVTQQAEETAWLRENDAPQPYPTPQADSKPAPSATAAEHVLPEFEELDDDLIDLACSTGALYRVDFKRAWEVMREGLRTPQPSPTPHADSQPAPAVDEDGERYRHLIETLDDQPHGKPTLGAAWDDDIGFWTKGSFFGLKDKASIDAAIDAERAQGNTL